MFKRRGTFFYARALAAVCLCLAAGPLPAQGPLPEASSSDPAAAESVPAILQAPSGPELWLRQLRDKDSAVRREARAKLVHGGEAAVRALVSSIQDSRTRELAQGALSEMGPSAVPALIALLRDAGLKMRAGGTLFVLIDPRSAAEARSLLGCAKDPEVKNYCLQSLVKAMGPKAGKQVPVLLEALADLDPDVRLHAAAALGAIGPKAKGATVGLIKAFADADSRVRMMSVEALAKVKPRSKAARDALKELAEKDSNEAVRRAAGKALEAFRG